MKTFCGAYDKKICRSCSWLETPYEEQIKKKETLLRNSLGSVFLDSVLFPTVQSAEQGFRNRVKLSVTGTLDHPVIGLLGEKDLDQGRELLECPIVHPRLNEVISQLPEWIQKYRLFPYQIAQRKGELKGLIAFYSPYSQEFYLRFILRSQECVSRLRKMTPSFQESFPDGVCLTANIQPIPHAILEGSEEIILTERKTIRHRLADLEFSLAPQAFVQTHVDVATQLYQAASEWIAEFSPARAMELYCGQGAFSFFARNSARKWVGVEVNSQAVEQAQSMAHSIGLEHLSFRCADATRIQSLIREEDPDLILVNPPRRGLGPQGVSQILHQLPRKLLYSSCSWETLGKDWLELQSHYSLVRAQIFDLFPHTDHFETLVLFDRR